MMTPYERDLIRLANLIADLAEIPDAIWNEFCYLAELVDEEQWYARGAALAEAQAELAEAA